MRQALVTKYFGPTNTRGSRIKVQASAGIKFYPWDYALGIEGNHTEAARKFAEHLGWDGSWVGGGLPEGNGNVYVLLSDGAPDFVVVPNA